MGAPLQRGNLLNLLDVPMVQKQAQTRMKVVYIHVRKHRLYHGSFTIGLLIGLRIRRSVLRERFQRKGLPTRVVGVMEPVDDETCVAEEYRVPVHGVLVQLARKIIDDHLGGYATTCVPRRMLSLRLLYDRGTML